MFTSIDKAIVAFITSGAFLFTGVTGIGVAIDPTALAVLGTTASALAVYFTPNK